MNVTGAVVALLIIFSLVGRLMAQEPILGIALVLAIASLIYAGLRIWRDPRQSKVIRRLSLSVALCMVIVELVLGWVAVIESSHMRFQEWHASGADVRAGMTLAEARGGIEKRSTISEQTTRINGVNFQIKPTGLIKDYQFLTEDLYYVDIEVNIAGRVKAVKTWHD